MSTQNKKINLWDRIMMAITFAEANDEKTAREIMTPGKEEKRPESRPRKEAENRPELRV